MNRRTFIGGAAADGGPRRVYCDRCGRATIPANYTESAYPLQYYFEVRPSAKTSLYPGFCPDLTAQPYYVLQRSV